jgi:hypothetical protein
MDASRDMTPRRAALPAALLFATLLAGCSRERLSTRERLSLASEPPLGGAHTVLIDESGPVRRQVQLEIAPVTRLPCDGHTLPLVSPDGRKLVLNARGEVPWAVRVGDPLPVGGLSCRLDSVSLAPDMPGAPLGTLSGPWILGRGASNEGYLAERPRADGGRDIALVSWEGKPRMVAEDEWCNAFATVAPDGAMAWCRRPPEGGDWQLVCERGGVRRVLRTTEGTSWLLPVFGGDGTGMFAFRLEGSSLCAVWLPFVEGGPPAEDATATPAMIIVVSLRANLSWAVRAMEPVSGLAASPPKRERLALWHEDLGRMALWAPGGTIEPLAERSFSVTVVDPENALVTVPDALLRERLIVSKHTTSPLSTGSWIARPTTLSAGELIGLRFDRSAVEVARLTLSPEEPPAAATDPAASNAPAH